MHQISFGNVLKEARLAKGLDLGTVSRELRIRQDIIVAIENSDFARMPSRGYARNMVAAYARLLGLNWQDVSRMYLDQEYAYQVEVAHDNITDNIRMHNQAGTQHQQRGNTASFGRVGSSRSSAQSRVGVGNHPYDGSSNGMGRTVYSQNADVYPTFGNSQPVTHRARRSAMPQGKYGNMYSAPSDIPNPNRKRNIVIGAIVAFVVLIGLVIGMLLTHQTQPQTNIPVTGAQSVGTSSEEASQQQEQTQTQQTTETAPTEFTLKYSVAKGSSSYIEVYVDDAVQESSTVSGPAEKTYTSSSKIRFVATETSGVTVYINDEAQELETNSSGIVNTTFTFSEILEQWYTNHPNVKRDASSGSSSTSTSSGAYSSSSASSKTTTSSSSSSN
jgi:cytoskeleton protein RodZ